MIASVRGVVQDIETGYLVIELGGVGVRVAVPESILDETVAIGIELQLWTQLILRQDSLSLYGFADSEQLSMFDLLLGAPGVGPKLAMAIVSGMSVDGLRHAITSDQPELLSRVPGVGIKTARKISFYLKDKIDDKQRSAEDGTFNTVDVELLEALTTLGYSVVEAQNAIQDSDVDSVVNLEDRIVLALRYLST
ncbi:MAG: Holliday junction branch migration protein RuvA [Anaerolineales bacterium]|jgi:Holliday junction DNA helicase RuvA|nr:Holliday junction branch migration protein RuvA [Anaerolineales bacterium]